MMKLDLKTSGISRAFDKIPIAYKIVVVLAINILLFVAVFMSVLSPQFELKGRLAGEYDQLVQDLNKLTLIKNNMPKYRKEYAQSQEALKGVLRQLPEKKDIPNLLRNVSTVGTESGTKIRSFEPKALVNKEFYGELPFEIKYSGSFHNVGYFFEGVRRLERIIDISSFSLDAKGPPTKVVLEGICLAKTYVYLHDAQREKKDGKSAKPAPK
jgi:type IV pilus assembly protein PilO